MIDMSMPFVISKHPAKNKQIEMIAVKQLKITIPYSVKSSFIKNQSFHQQTIPAISINALMIMLTVTITVTTEANS